MNNKGNNEEHLPFDDAQMERIRILRIEKEQLLATAYQVAEEHRQVVAQQEEILKEMERELERAEERARSRESEK